MKDFLMNNRLELIKKCRAIAVIRENSFAKGLLVAEALVRCGLPAIEVTLTTPGAFEIIQEIKNNSLNNSSNNLTNNSGKEILFGLGSLLHKADLEKGISLGVSFYASPVGIAELINLAKENSILSMPAGLTPTEIYNLHLLGADIIKVFPAPNPNYIKSILSTMPWLRLAPSGGITDLNVKEFLANGAYVLNIGGWLTNGLITDFNGILQIDEVELLQRISAVFV